MLPRNTHIIQKQSFEISFENPETTLGLQDQIAQVFYENLKPRMEKMFDEMFDNDQYTIIDRLDIELGTLDPENWEQEFTDRAIEKLKISLATAQKDSINYQNYHSQKSTEIFFFYLENGFMPWNSRLSSTTELEKLLPVDDQLIISIKKLIAQKETVAQRLVYQFSETFTQLVISKISADWQGEIRQILELLPDFAPASSPPQTRQQLSKKIADIALLQVVSTEHEITAEKYFSILLKLVQNDNIQETWIKNIISDLSIRNHHPETSPNKATTTQDVFHPDVSTHEKETEKAPERTDEALLIQNAAPVKTDVEAIYIENAGLVLLHPFLMSLFENLGLVKDETWQDDFCRKKAVLILEYLAKGISQAEEHELVLNKIMCGLQPEEVINTEILLEAGTLTECESLLTAVIENWSILRNTSVESLRETFLIRTGKLSAVDGGWLLQVEQKPFDMLLGHLPWGIGIVKMPVMSEIIFVEWA